MFLKWTRVLALMFALLGGANGTAQDTPLDAKILEQRFAGARDLQIVRTVAELPADVKEKLLGERRGWIVAELGESWHSGREPDDPTTMPTGQHLFSAVSKDLFFILIQISIHSRSPHANVKLYLGERNSPKFCTYVYEEMNIRRLRLDSFQEGFNVRARTTPRGELPRTAPVCTPHVSAQGGQAQR